MEPSKHAVSISSGQSCQPLPAPKQQTFSFLAMTLVRYLLHVVCMVLLPKVVPLTILPDAPSHKIFPMWRRRYPKERHRASGPGILFLCAKDEIILFRTRNNKLAFKSLNRYEKGYSTYCQIYVSFCTYDLRYSTKSYSVALTFDL